MIIACQSYDMLNCLFCSTGPTVVPACSDEVAFSGIYSQNSGPHSLRYLWNVSVMSFNASNATNYDSMVAMETILQYFPQSFTSNPLLTLPSSAFDEEYYYTIFLTARNFLGFHSNSSVIVTKQPMEVMLLGNNFVRVNPLDDVIVEVTVQTTSCHVMSDSLQFSWAMEDTSNRDNVSDVTHLLDTTTLLSPLLWIPRHTLLPGHQYRLIASLTSTQSSGVLAGYHSIQMDVSHPNIVIRFVGGAYVTLPHGSDVLLDISPSLNLDQYSKDEVGVSWGCVTGNPPSPCMNVVSDEILSLPSALTFTIPPTHLTPGTYRMTATIAGPSSASGSLLVNILQPSAPGGGVRIVTVERGRPCIVPADEAVIEALVQTPQVGVIEWEGLFVPGKCTCLCLMMSSLHNPHHTPTIPPLTSPHPYHPTTDLTTPLPSHHSPHHTPTIPPLTSPHPYHPTTHLTTPLPSHHSPHHTPTIPPLTSPHPYHPTTHLTTPLPSHHSPHHTPTIPPLTSPHPYHPTTHLTTPLPSHH